MQCAQKVLMVRPASFGFNTETAVTNAFQKSSGISAEQLRQQAQAEFDAAIVKLQASGIAVMVVEDNPLPVKPDAVFPNNWIYCHHDGRIFLFPMHAPNRRLERRMDVIEFLSDNYHVTGVVHFEESEHKNLFLEGTGSMVMDHLHKIIYACISPRTNPELVNEFAQKISYRAVLFNASDVLGKEIYHTNVVMSIGEKWAILCTESIRDEHEREEVLGALKASGRVIIEITLPQMNAFAGNVLEIKNKGGQNICVLSETAYQALTIQQKRQIEITSQLLRLSIPVIEQHGGGSARCMIAEIFLPG